MDGNLTLTIVTPDGQCAAVSCDSVRLTVPDGAKKNNPGGGVGIRRGHTDALMAVAAGSVKALLAGETVLDCTVSDGFASVSGGDTVVILTEKASVRTIRENI
ncbi:MAG: hypothetical protein IJ480_08845 [Clostridia bacterium]|nr:hypothetical protein [Clostridia bacterium]